MNADKVAADSPSGPAINEPGLDSSVLQRRVTGVCASGQAIRQVAQDGTVTCQAAGGGGGTVTQVDTGFGLAGGPITSSGTVSVDDTAVQRRVTGSCSGSQAVQSINAAGTVSCGGPQVVRIHAIVPSSNGAFGGAYDILQVGHLGVLGLCHSQVVVGSAIVTGTKVLFSNEGNNTGDTLNWFYSDGTNVSAAGTPVGTTSDPEFNFDGKRIEGQFIYSEYQASDITVSLHAYDGGSFCEFAGTAVRAT